MQQKAVLYDKGGDQHYDYISAWIKSTRGSDPDASLLLPRGDARGRRGPALHRAPDDHPRLRGHRQRRPAGAGGGGRRGGARSSTSGCPRPSTRSPRRPSTSRWRRSPTPPTRAIGAAREHIRDRGADLPPGPLRSAAYPAARKLGRGIGYDYPHSPPGRRQRPGAPARGARGPALLRPGRHGAAAARAPRGAPPRPRPPRVRLMATVEVPLTSCAAVMVGEMTRFRHIPPAAHVPGPGRAARAPAHGRAVRPPAGARPARAPRRRRRRARAAAPARLRPRPPPRPVRARAARRRRDAGRLRRDRRRRGRARTCSSSTSASRGGWRRARPRADRARAARAPRRLAPTRRRAMPRDGTLESRSPATGERLGAVEAATARRGARSWRRAPRRRSRCGRRCPRRRGRATCAAPRGCCSTTSTSWRC